MAQQHQRLIVAARTEQARRDNSAPGARLPDGCRNTVGEKFLLEQFRERQFIAGRVGRIDADLPAQEIGRFAGELVVIDRFGRRRRFGKAFRMAMFPGLDAHRRNGNGHSQDGDHADSAAQRANDRRS